MSMWANPAVVEPPARKMNVLEMVDTINELAEMMATAATPEEHVVCQTEFERMLSEDLPQKIDAIEWVRQRLTGQKAARKSMMEDIRDSIRSLDKQDERLRDLLLMAVIASGQKSASGKPALRGEMFTATVHEGDPPLLIKDKESIPDDYMTVNVAMSFSLWTWLTGPGGALNSPNILPQIRVIAVDIDQKGIEAELKANRPVPGAELDKGKDFITITRNTRRPKAEGFRGEASELLSAQQGGEVQQAEN